MTVPLPIAPASVVEPIAEAAHWQLETARRLCAPGCRAYHGIRLYLRAAGILRGVGPDSRFLLDAFTRLATERPVTRALITGAADFGVLAHLSAAFRAAGRSLAVTVVDRCATPLEMNRWFAEREGLSIETAQTDVLDFRADVPFDLIASHAFVGQFRSLDRPRLADKWLTLLGPDGAVVTAHHLEPVGSGNGRDRTVDPGYAARVRARAEHAFRGVPPDERVQLAEWLEAYLREKSTYGVWSPEEATRVFQQAGFGAVAVHPGVSDHAGDPVMRVRFVLRRRAED